MPRGFFVPTGSDVSDAAWLRSMESIGSCLSWRFFLCESPRTQQHGRRPHLVGSFPFLTATDAVADTQKIQRPDLINHVHRTA